MKLRKKKRNPLAGRAPRGRPRRAPAAVIDEDSPVVPKGRRRIPPIFEDDEEDGDETLIPSP